MWESHAALAGVTSEELRQYQQTNTEWQLAKLTGWTLEYIGSLSPEKIRHFFAIEDGVAEARKP